MSNTQNLGPYGLVERIAHSDVALSFGVSVGTRSGAERIAALKILNPDITSNAEFARRLEEEVALAEQLNHVNLAQTWDFAKRDGVYYLLLEYVEGVPLSVLLGNSAIPQSVAAYICSELCAGLSYAHARRDRTGKSLGIVHGDLRPRHILMSTAGAVKLVDFGVARARKLSAEDPVPEALRDADLYAYADPRHANGEEPDVIADIFSVCALLWRMIVGKPIFDAPDAMASLTLAQAGGLIAPSEAGADIDSDLEQIIMRGLRASDEREFASAQSLRTALAAWLREHDPGFGRHRVKEHFGDALSDSIDRRRSRALTRREFTPEDTASVIHNNVKGQDLDDQVNIRELLKSGGDIADADTPPPAPAPRATASAAPPKPAAPSARPATSTRAAAAKPAAPKPAAGRKASAPDEMPPPPAPPKRTQALSPDDTAAAAAAEEEDDLLSALMGSEPTGDKRPSTDDRMRRALGTMPLSAVTDDELDDLEAIATGGSTKAERSPSASPRPSAPKPSSSASTAEKRPSLAEVLSARRASAAEESAGAQDRATAPRPQAAAGSEHSPAPEPLEEEVTQPRVPRPESRGATQALGTSVRLNTRDIDALDDDDLQDEALEASDSAPQRAATTRPRAAQPASPSAEQAASFDADDIASAVYDDAAEIYYDEEEDDLPKRSNGKGVRNALIAVLGLALIGALGFIVYTQFIAGGGEDAVQETTGSLFVTSRPQGARIFIDGQATGQTAPATIEGLEGGATVRVRAELDGYTPSPEVSAQITAGSASDVSVELQPVPHTIRVTSEPSGATVYYNGDNMGETPTLVGPLTAPSGFGVSIMLDLEGYERRTIDHNWQPGESRSDINVELVEAD